MTTTAPLVDKFLAMQDRLNSRVLNRREENRTACLALLSKKHHFQVGPPGIAKSYLVSELARCIDMPPDGYFHYLLTKHTVPDELYGAVDLQEFKKSVFKRNTESMLPRAHIAFLDEIFKGNSAILNANLMLLNERLFHNHTDDPHVPLISCFAASNEVPTGDELNALWDRLHFRHVVGPFTETSDYVQMLEMQMAVDEIFEPIMSLADIRAAHDEVSKVHIGDDVLTHFRDLREALRREGVEPTERRWVESLGIVKAEAWFNGHDAVEVHDLRPLHHVLWSFQTDIVKVRKVLLQMANPIDKDAADLMDDVSQLETDLRTAIKLHGDDQKTLINECVEIHEKLGRARDEMNVLIEKEATAPRPSLILSDLKKKVADLAVTLKRDGFKR